MFSFHVRRLGSLSLVVASVLNCTPRFVASAAPRLPTSSQEQQQAFRAAAEQFGRGELAAADESMAKICLQHPQAAVCRAARLYRGRIALRLRRLEHALALLRPLAEGETPSDVSRPARYFLGLVQSQRGAYADARRLLAPLEDSVDQASLPALLSSLAVSEEALGALDRAAKLFARLHQAGSRPADKAFARQRLESLIQQRLDARQVEELCTTAQPGSLLFALATRRRAGDLRKIGASNEAAALAERAQASWTSHGITPRESDTSQAQEPAIVVALPLSGRLRSAGRLALSGALAAAKQGSPGVGAPGIDIEILDTQGPIAASIRALSATRRIVALLGALSPTAASTLADTATRIGVPFLSMSPTGGGGLGLIPSSTQRAAALAAQLPKRTPDGDTKVAILAPQTPYGQQMSNAFAHASAQRGIRVYAKLAYASTTHSFAEVTQGLRSVDFNVLFVPDRASRLTLLAPALALAGIWPGKIGEKAPKGRSIQLLATADGLSPTSLARASRYLQHAILAPGFVVHSRAKGQSDSRIAALQRFVQRPPHPLQAFAFDGMNALLFHVGRGARQGPLLIQALRKTRYQGITGAVFFGVSGLQSRSAALYRVVGKQAIALEEQPPRSDKKPVG